MFNRRNFLSKSMLLSGAASLGLLSCNEQEAAQTAPPPKENPNAKESLPVIIATWNNLAATNAAMQTLMDNGTALDAVEAGARVPEADPNDQSVGYGGLPDRDGNVTLDACIMDAEGNAGSVTFLQHIKHPISVARKVMEKTPHVMLSGAGALQFALAEGFEKENLLTPEAAEKWKAWCVKKEYKPVANIERHDTIGILGIDSSKNIAGACTTSGMAYKLHGRVGDSPIIGAGMFVDNEVGGAVATGVGEYVMKTLGSFLIVELMRQGRSPQEACEEAISRIITKHGDQLTDDFQVGYLALDKLGRHGAFAILKGFNYSIYQEGENKLYESGFGL